jgi:hypothetical protein
VKASLVSGPWRAPLSSALIRTTDSSHEDLTRDITACNVAVTWRERDRENESVDVVELSEQLHGFFQLMETIFTK